MYIDRYIYHYNCLLNFILYPIALFLTSTHCTCAGSESLCLEQVLMNISQSWLAVKPKHVHVHFTAVLPNTKSNRQLASIPPTKKKIVVAHPWPHHLTIARPSGPLCVSSNCDLPEAAWIDPCTLRGEPCYGPMLWNFKLVYNTGVCANLPAWLRSWPRNTSPWQKTLSMIFEMRKDAQSTCMWPLVSMRNCVYVQGSLKSRCAQWCYASMASMILPFVICQWPIGLSNGYLDLSFTSQHAGEKRSQDGLAEEVGNLNMGITCYTYHMAMHIKHAKITDQTLRYENRPWEGRSCFGHRAQNFPCLGSFPHVFQCFFF